MSLCLSHKSGPEPPLADATLGCCFIADSVGFACAMALRGAERLESILFCHYCLPFLALALFSFSFKITLHSSDLDQER